MTSTEIITEFELQVNDVTELSTAEELIILNRVYRKVQNDRPWEWLKKEATGTILSDANGSYITPPADFGYIFENGNYSQFNQPDIVGTSVPKVIFVGTTHTPYFLVNFSDRRQYRDKVGYAYYDAVNNQIRFTGTPDGSTYEFDYIYIPDDLVGGGSPTSPVFPARFHEILIYGMAVENEIIQLSPKAKSYAPENQAYYEGYLADLASWNANLIVN